MSDDKYIGITFGNFTSHTVVPYAFDPRDTPEARAANEKAKWEAQERGRHIDWVNARWWRRLFSRCGFY